ncbi:MAG: hypothetical protein J7K46_10830 [Bacteroidales bacterium]|nr:hypothetical protein [Bacteroidales bacterium]
MKKISIFLFFLLCLSFDYPAFSQQKVVLPELKEKQKGFFTRVNLGLATGKTNFGDYFNITGPTVPFSIQAGNQLNPRLALYLVFGMLINVQPKVSDGGYSDLVSVPQLGGGFSYYFGKGKTYLNADINYAVTSVSSDGSSGSTNGGFALNVGYGYDFNIVKRIDIGTNVFYHYSSMTDKPSTFGEPQVTNNFLGVCFSFRFGR